MQPPIEIQKCSNCCSRNINILDSILYECYDCGETFSPFNSLYGENISPDEIVMYEWCHNLDIEHTMRELQMHGAMVSKIAIIETWVALDERYDN